MPRRKCHIEGGRGAGRVSEAQWEILLGFLELNPTLARSRYNNSAQGRATSLRLWQQVAEELNAEGSGCFKTAQDWSVYVSNFKSKLKSIAAQVAGDYSGTGGGPGTSVHHEASLTEVQRRFLAILGRGFGQQSTHGVRINPFLEEDQQQPSSSASAGPAFTDPNVQIEHFQYEDFQSQFSVLEEIAIVEPQDVNFATTAAEALAISASDPLGVKAPATHSRGGNAAVPSQGVAACQGDRAPPLPLRGRRTRYRARPLAPLDEARSVLQQIESQRAAADAAKAQAMELIGRSLERIASAFEKYLERQ